MKSNQESFTVIERAPRKRFQSEAARIVDIDEVFEAVDNTFEYMSEHEKPEEKNPLKDGFRKLLVECIHSILEEEYIRQAEILNEYHEIWRIFCEDMRE